MNLLRLGFYGKLASDKKQEANDKWWPKAWEKWQEARIKWREVFGLIPYYLWSILDGS